MNQRNQLSIRTCHTETHYCQGFDIAFMNITDESVSLGKVDTNETCI